MSEDRAVVFVVDDAPPCAARKIDKKITKHRVEMPTDKAAAEKAAAEAPRKESNAVWMHEKVERPEVLVGSTYKIKTPLSDHAI